MIRQLSNYFRIAFAAWLIASTCVPTPAPVRVIPGPIVAAAGASNGLLNNLVAYWKLDEASGTRNDSVGSNHLTDNNTVTSVAGKLNNAAEFTAANNESLTISDNADLSTGDIDFTITRWVKLADITASHAVDQKGMNDAYGEHMLMYAAGGIANFQWFIADLAANVISTDPATISSGQWYFVATWYDSTANTLNIQVNNGAIASASYSGGNTSTPGTFKIGQGIGNWFDGDVDEEGFWKAVLTPAQRTTLYGGGTPPAFSTFTH